MKAMMCSAVLALVSPAFAGGEVWTADFEAAKKDATASGKDLLIDFTGSDWCGWCKKLVAEVFSQEAFKQGVKDSFVLVEVDFPRDRSKLSEEQLAANKELGGKYGVRGYPTVLLCDAEGRPFGITGYQAGGPDAYVKHLNELREARIQRDKALAEAASVQGVAKAKALIAALESLHEALPRDEELISKFYGSLSEEIKAADPSDETGYRKNLAQAAKMEEFKTKLAEFHRAKNHDAALQFCDETLAKGEITGAGAQRVMTAKTMILKNTGRLDQAIAEVDKAIAYAPEKGNEGLRALKAKLVQMKEQVEARKKEPAEKAPEGQATDAVKPKANPEPPIRVRDN